VRKGISSKARNAAQACLIYGTGATAWILLSSYVTSRITANPEILSQIEMAKGVGFVLVTTILFYASLRSWGSGSPDASTPDGEPRSGWGLLAVVSALILLVPLVGYGTLRLSTPSLEQDAYYDLRAISALQLESISLWQAEREGKLQHAIAAYQQGLQTSQFADQAIDFRTHWFEESFAKFSAWRLYELRDHLSHDQRADAYLQIFHAADELMLRQRVGDHWLAVAGQATNARAAYECYQRAGWDVGLQRISDYEQLIGDLIRSATAAGDQALAEVAKVHLSAM
jgi:hypothetical protein